MPNSELALQCTVTTRDAPEGILLKNDKAWSSPPGGWLKVQAGKWVQNSTAGVVLISGVGEKVGFLDGLIFDTATIPDAGNFKYDVTGEAGGWRVVS